MKVLAVLLLLAAGAAPCLWDSDTLDTELRGLPDAFDLVTGRWHRHSDAYYRERVRRLGGKVDATLAELDDLAVAHEHLGERAQAIEVMQQKAALLAKQPDREHQYRYLANLGTFYAHDGNYPAALVELKKAVALNPAAHFGRENFQIALIEYAAAAKAEPALWAQRSFLRHADYYLGCGFLRSLVEEEHDGNRELDWDRAYEAIGGMLRFGGREGPELYRSLGELFLVKEHLNLAWWAFRHAIERGHPAQEQLLGNLRYIEKHWQEAEAVHLVKATGVRAPSEVEYAAIRASADRWLATFHELETAAIERGEDVSGDVALRQLLAEADRRVPRPSTPRWWSGPELVVGGTAVILALWGFDKWRRRRRMAASGSPGGTTRLTQV
jgi:tetratricopeptide (TPR) repeat protein